MEARRAPDVLRRIGGTAGLILAGLLYLQFALQAFFAAPAQAVLVLVGAVAFAIATVRFIRHRRLAYILFVGTLPLFVFSLATTFIYPDESSVFAVIFGVAPALSGPVWLWRRNSDPSVAVTGHPMS